VKTNPKNKIREKIQDFFLKKEDVFFVYLFGSFISKQKFRDIDIAIYMESIPDIIGRGKLQVALDNLLNLKNDLVLLNKLPSKNPAFAYEITTKGELLVCRDNNLHTQYKSRVLQYYFDTAYLPKQFNEAFKTRIISDKFGERNYE
jgi:predicted nucleotidyltransferase